MPCQYKYNNLSDLRDGLRSLAFDALFLWVGTQNNWVVPDNIDWAKIFDYKSALKAHMSHTCEICERSAYEIDRDLSELDDLVENDLDDMADDVRHAFANLPESDIKYQLNYMSH